MMDKWMKEEVKGLVNFADLVMLYDTKFWKAARKAWSHVLIEAMMKDYEAKKKLANVSFLYGRCIALQMNTTDLNLHR